MTSRFLNLRVFWTEGAEVIRTPIRACGQTPMLSGGCRPSGWSVWTGRWCWAGAILCGCCAFTPGTITSSDRTAASRRPCPKRGPRVQHRSARERSDVAMYWAASSMSITRSQPDEPDFRAPQAVWVCSAVEVVGQVGVFGDRVQGGETGGRAVDHGHGDGAVERHHRGGPDRQQQVLCHRWWPPQRRWRLGVVAHYLDERAWPESTG